MIFSQNIKTLPIFMYHALSEQQEANRYIIRRGEFEAHLRYLHTEKINTMLVDDFFTLLTENGGTSLSNLLLTFDDGHMSDYNIALPLLKKYGLSATFFITTDWIDRPRYMTADQIRELRQAGMSVQSHGKSHAFLSELDSKNLYRELAESKKKLEEILGESVFFLSFPGGRYNRHVIDAAWKAGYKGIFSSYPFQLRQYDTCYLIGRYGVTSPCSEANFANIIHLGSIGRAKVLLLANIKFLLKKILGNRLYYFLWKKYMWRNT